MRIGVTYDLRSDYLALGYGEEETAEFDAEETIAAVVRCPGRPWAMSPIRIGGIKPLTEAPGGGRTLGRGVQYLRRPERRFARGPGAGAAGSL